MPAIKPPTAQPASLDMEQRSRLQSLLSHRLHQLVSPFENAEPWYRWDAVIDRWENAPRGLHVVELPSLLEQLRQSTKQAFGSSAGGYESRPIAHLEAIDAEQRLDVEAAMFVGGVLHVRPSSVEANLALIRERIPTLADDDLCERRDAKGELVNDANLETLVRSWWVSARILSGLDARPLTPRAHCPLCDAVDSLRVRLDVADRTGLAWCKECKGAWDESNIGLLREAIRAEHDEPERNDEEDDA